MNNRDFWRRKYLEATQELDFAGKPQLESDRAHLFTTAAGVLVPMFQAVITGAMVGTLACVYSWWLGSTVPWKWAFGVGLAAAVIAWVSLIVRWSTLTAPLERFTGWDINRDGQIGVPETVRVELKTDNGKSTQIAELPVSREKLTDFARGVMNNGYAISERRWSGAGALFSQNEFRALRDVMLARDWMRWINSDFPQQGIELTEKGKAVLKYLANPFFSNQPISRRAVDEFDTR